MMELEILLTERIFDILSGIDYIIVSKTALIELPYMKTSVARNRKAKTIAMVVFVDIC